MRGSRVKKTDAGRSVEPRLLMQAAAAGLLRSHEQVAEPAAAARLLPYFCVRDGDSPPPPLLARQAIMWVIVADELVSCISGDSLHLRCQCFVCFLGCCSFPSGSPLEAAPAG